MDPFLSKKCLQRAAVNKMRGKENVKRKWTTFLPYNLDIYSRVKGYAKLPTQLRICDPECPFGAFHTIGLKAKSCTPDQFSDGCAGRGQMNRIKQK